MLKDDYNTTSATTSAATVVVPTYLDRSISAPPLSGYASFEDFLPSSSPQRPKPVKSAHFEGSPTESSRHASFLEGISASLDILDDDHLGSIKSLVIDSKPKTPMDLIQADFPLTPSAVYSHGKLVTTDPKSPSHEADETDELDDVLTGIDQSSLAMQDLLNPEDEIDDSPSGGGVAASTFSSQPKSQLPSQFPNPNLAYGMYNPQPQTVPPNMYTFPSLTGGQQNSSSLLPQDPSGTLSPNSQSLPYPLQQQNGNYPPVDNTGGHSMDMATAQQVANPYYQQMMLQPQMYMDYYRMGMVPPGAYPMAFAQGDMSFAQTPDGMPYLAYPQQTLPGFWPQPNQSNRLNDPSQQNMMYYGQQPTAADFNGMNMMMGMNMMGMNAGGIMTPHGFIPAGNPALQLGYQQMGNGMTMPNATGSVFMHPQNNRSNHAAHNSHSNMKHDHQDNQSNSSGNSNRRSNSNNPPNGGRNNSGNSSGRSSNQNSQAHAAASRDLLVEDFRNTYGKTKQWEIKDLVGHVVAFCQDQHGSRFIQQRLEVAPESDKQIIFKEVLPNAHPLMTDVFGNYVIQKLFEFGTPEQCETLAALLTGQAVTLALQMYGCRVIQKALEYVQTPRLIILISEFEGQQVLRCVHDQNGNHVIQKCIEVISRVAKDSPAETSEFLNSRIQFIIQSFKGRVRELSIHPYGCRVIQRILEYCNSEHKMIVLEELRSNCHELIQDQYGNYVIQHVMQHGYDLDKSILLTEVQSKLLEYSQHKFASNVVEKCIQYADKTYRDEIIWTIINVTFDLNNPVDAQTGQCVLENMVRDPYANYVVQKVIDVSNESQRGAIIRYVRENIIQLRRYTYGKHIIVRLEKVSGEKF